MAWMTEKGYWRVRVFDHPHRPPGSDVYVHVLIIERELGRKLRTDEAVHHLNGDKGDNRRCNLLLTDFPAHQRVHAAEMPRDERGRFLPKRQRRRKQRAA